MKPVVKEIYLDIEKQLKAYGYKLYKGKIWRYDPAIGYVIGIEVELTRWGTLNEIYVSASSYLAPIKQNDFTAKNEPLLMTWLKTCLLYRRCEGVNVFSMGDPYQPVDKVLRKQYDELRPFLVKKVFPLLMFDADKKSYLQSIEKIQNKACEASTGIKAVENAYLALDYCYCNDIKSALRIIDLYILYCDTNISIIMETTKHLSSEERQEITERIEQKKTKAISFSKTIKAEPETIKRMIDENRTISERTCQQFFTSRFFSKKA